MSNSVPFADLFCAVSKDTGGRTKKEDFSYSPDLQLNINWRNISNDTGTYMSWTDDHDK